MNTDVRSLMPRCSWIPAFAGMTSGGRAVTPERLMTVTRTRLVKEVLVPGA